MYRRVVLALAEYGRRLCLGIGAAVQTSRWHVYVAVTQLIARWGMAAVVEVDRRVVGVLARMEEGATEFGTDVAM